MARECPNKGDDGGFGGGDAYKRTRRDDDGGYSRADAAGDTNNAGGW